MNTESVALCARAHQSYYALRSMELDRKLGPALRPPWSHLTHVKRENYRTSDEEEGGHLPVVRMA
ncbi:hypothetical protein HJFPF1_03201 [Paramyrothecium foliicola]|nr:hypothetical protein HJFPF1_03201 [Paramyrothecium foliicola]